MSYVMIQLEIHNKNSMTPEEITDEVYNQIRLSRKLDLWSKHDLIIRICEHTGPCSKIYCQDEDHMHLKADSITVDEAKERYTKAWNDWRGEPNDLVKRRLEIIMDSLQPHIGKENWSAFKDTLEGFNEYWQGLAKQYKESINGQDRR